MNKNKPILIVAIKTNFRNELETYFNNLDYWKVDKVDSLFSAKKKTQRKHYGLILCDDILPANTGLQLLRDLVEEKIPYDNFALMGNPNRDEIAEVVELGSWWVEKPMDQPKIEKLLLDIENYK